MIHRQARFAIYMGCVALTFLVSLLIWEYLQLRKQMAKVEHLYAQYHSYLESVKHVLNKQPDKSDTESNGQSAQEDDEIMLDSFLVLNRSSSYLKESTETYLKDKQLDGLIKNINPNSWRDYTEQVIMGVHQPEAILSARKNVPKPKHTNQTFKAPTFNAQKLRKRPLTNISFKLPIEPTKYWVSSYFGPRKKPNGQWGFHNGVDMAAHRGTLVAAAAGGIVEQAERVPGYGNTVVIKHDAVYKTRYAHLDTILTQAGSKVASGGIIGKVGDTGFTRKQGKDASHLHLELYEKGKQINPLTLLPI